MLAGEDSIRVFRPSGGGMSKAFCACCGSSLFGGTWPEGRDVSVRLGALDGDPAIRPRYRSFFASRAPWDVDCDDGLTRYDERPPRDEA